MRAWALATVWILGGSAVGAALFWLLLNTPESTVFMLAGTLLLALAIYVVAAVTWSGALLGWARGWSAAALRGAWLGIGLALPPLIAIAAVWWVVSAAQRWILIRQGEISAWFIATLDWGNVTPLFAAIEYAGDWFKLIAVPFIGLTWLASMLRSGFTPLIDRASLAHATRPLRLLTATAIVILLVWAPSHYALYWMPAGLPPTWVEPAVAAAKLAAIAILGAAGLGLVAKLAGHR
ncbi:MAG: hypothetical protein IT178_10745 [Acidobacteria bacterium]|nr:hypothetical protein [Acidobacteriota bacterium]